MQNSLSQNHRVDVVLHHVKKDIILLSFLVHLIIIIVIVIIIIIIIIIQSCDAIICHFFCLRFQADEGWHVPLLEGKILAGNYLIRGSSVFTYIESSYRNMWGALASTIFCIFCSDGLPEIWLIKFWMLFLIMPRAPITTGIILVLSFHVFVTSISRCLYLESFRNSLWEIFYCRNCNIYHDACILFKIFYCNVWLVCFYVSICIDSEVL